MGKMTHSTSGGCFRFGFRKIEEHSAHYEVEDWIGDGPVDSLNKTVAEKKVNQE
jgi:hypothetical protein